MNSSRMGGSAAIAFNGAALLRVVLASAWTVALCGTASPAPAPSEDVPSSADSSGGLQEITVTARRRSESLMDVPVAASVVDSATLTNRGITDMTALAKLVPSVSIEPDLGAGGGSFTIRGIGTSGTDAGAESSVAVNFDGVNLSRGQIIRESLFDLDQVEVLKGPQALFFGKNSPGGVVSVNSRGPTDQLEVSVKTGYEFYAQEKSIEAAVSGPITDTLGARVAIYGTDMRGWIHNVAQSIDNPFADVPGQSPTLPGASYTYNGLKEIAGRLTLQFKPTNDLTATLRLFGSANQNNGDASNVQTTRCGASGKLESGINGVVDPFGSCGINGTQSLGALPSGYAAGTPLFDDGDDYGRFNSFMGSFSVDYSTGPLALTSITGFVHYDQVTSDSVSKTVFSVTDWNASVDKFQQLSEEVRLVSTFKSPVNFTVGAYYEHNALGTQGAVILGPFSPDPRNGSYATSEKQTFSRGNAYSGFGQLRWNIIETLELAGGARYTKEVKQGTAENTFVNESFPATFIYAPEGVLYSAQTSNSNVSPEVTLSWHPVHDSTLYAAYKTGFLSGGFGAPTLLTANIVSGNELIYRPETVKGGEIGLKTMLFDNAVRLTSAVFYYNYKGLQLSNFNAAADQQTIENVGGARTEGFEAEALWRAMQKLTLHAALSYTRARYTSFQIACYVGQTPATGCNTATDSQDLTGQALVRAPDWTGNAGFDYETDLSASLKIGFTGDARYSDKYFTQENNNPVAVQGQYGQIDASVRVLTADDRWRVSLIGQNLTNKVYAISSFDSTYPGQISSGVSRGREVLLQAGYKF
jgi:iron complex outermembrane receptor protein